MAQESDNFLKRLLATFKLEANEHVTAMSQLLLSLEKLAPDAPATATVETLFREAHSLKGAARSVDQFEIESLCRALESIFSKLKHDEIPRSPPLFDVLLNALDQLSTFLATDSADARNWSSLSLVEQIDALGLAREGAPIASYPAATAPGQHAANTPLAPLADDAALGDSAAGKTDPAAPDTVRISIAKLGVLLTQIEELFSLKFNSGHLISELQGLRANVSTWKRLRDKTARDCNTTRPHASRHGRVRAESIDTLAEDSAFAKSLIDHLKRLEHHSELERRAVSGMLDDLLGDMKQVLMLPISTLFDWVPKTVRDLARDSGKEIELHLSRTPIEIDRRILEQLKTPLLHLIRNAVDHGIEVPSVRVEKGKPAHGGIVVEVIAQDGNKIELRIIDDGAGPDIEKIRAQAIKTALLSAETAADLSDEEVMALMFESGFSTSTILTDVSGRGLGLAIVREKIEKIGGKVTVEKPAAGGCCFRLSLPTSLANFHGVLLRIGERHFIMPSLNVECVVRIASSQIKTVENRDTVDVNGQVISLVKLSDVLQISRTGSSQTPDDIVQIVVMTSAGKRIAFSVDAVIGDREVLVRGLGPQLPRVRNIAGATVLGAGQVFPILNPSDLLKSALKVTPAQLRPEPLTVSHRQSILVVEDSITSRALIKNILESAGYVVAGAVDGIDALTALRSGKFDLVVSDVEMPRMDGFDLTGRIRADKQLGALPVILVTALDSREHKEHGIEVGANAYLVKSSFDQSNLLDAVKRLI